MSGPLPFGGKGDRGDQNGQFRTPQLNIIDDPAHAPNGGSVCSADGVHTYTAKPGRRAA